MVHPPDPRPVADFNRRFIETYGAAPHLLAPLAYDGLRLIARQAQSAGTGGVSPQAFATASAFSGASGEFRFLSNGTNRRGLAIATIRNNNVTILKQAGSSGAAGS